MTNLRLALTRYFHLLTVTLCLSLIQACSFLPKETSQTGEIYDWQTLEPQLRELNNWSLLGKIGIRTKDESITAAINKWDQTNEQFEIDLSSTFFGLGSSKLIGNEHFLIIYESGEEPISSNEPELLVESALGIPLPIAHLTYWIKALPAQNIAHKLKFNDQGLPDSLRQDNWSIQFSDYHLDKKLPLPGKIKLQRDNIRIVLAVKEWNIH